MWPNGAHEKGLFLVAPQAKYNKKRGLEHASKARARKFGVFEAASMCFGLNLALYRNM